MFNFVLRVPSRRARMDEEVEDEQQERPRPVVLHDRIDRHLREDAERNEKLRKINIENDADSRQVDDVRVTVSLDGVEKLNQKVRERCAIALHSIIFLTTYYDSFTSYILEGMGGVDMIKSTRIMLRVVRPTPRPYAFLSCYFDAKSYKIMRAMPRQHLRSRWAVLSEVATMPALHLVPAARSACAAMRTPRTPPRRTKTI